MARRSPLFPIFLIVIVDIFGLTLVLPLLAPYAERFGASPLQATLLVSLYAGCQLIAGPALGRISDRTGRRPMLLVSQVGTCIGFILMASAKTLWIVYLARALDGLTAGNLSLAQAYISDHTAPEDRSRSFALIGIAFGVGFFIGPGISGYLLKHVAFQAPIWLAAGMSATSILCTATLLPNERPAAAAEGPAGPGGERLSLLQFGAYLEFFRRPGLPALFVEFLCFCLGFSVFTSGFSLFLERRFAPRGWGAAEAGYVFMYAGFLGILIQGRLLRSRRFVQAVGERRLALSAFVAAAIGYVLLGLAHSTTVLLIAATFSSYGNGVLRPILTSLITQAADRREQGVVLGLNQSLNSLAQIACPILAGLLIKEQWLTVWALAAAAAAAVGLAVALASPSPTPSPQPSA